MKKIKITHLVSILKNLSANEFRKSRYQMTLNIKKLSQ